MDRKGSPFATDVTASSAERRTRLRQHPKGVQQLRRAASVHWKCGTRRQPRSTFEWQPRRDSRQRCWAVRDSDFDFLATVTSLPRRG